MRRILSVFGMSLYLMCGCGQSSTQSSQSKALVNVDQAQEAFELVQAIDYIPFTFILDGCYARSLYMSMELAARGIPSSAHYIYGNLQPTSDVSWWFHVAPLLKVEDDDGEAWVLDPAFEAEPLRRSEWIERNNPWGHYQTEIKAGSAYFDESGRTDEFDSENMIETFDEMPAFLSSDITSACTVMYGYLSNTAKNSSELTALRKKLLSQTSLLVTALNEQGKLQNTGVSYDANYSCRAAVGL